MDPEVLALHTNKLALFVTNSTFVWLLFIYDNIVVRNASAFASPA